MTYETSGQLRLPTWLRERFRWQGRPDRQTQVLSPQSRPIYLFFDEAGDLDFGPTGSRYFVCGIVAVRDPWPLMNALQDLRETLFRGSLIPERFHASEDKQLVRDKVFETIGRVGDIAAYLLISVKALVPESHRDSSDFYSFKADLALRAVLNRYPVEEPIYLITDALPVKRKREAVIKGLKSSLASIAGNRVFEIAHHSSASQGCLQVTDYVTWAAFRKWERADIRSYRLVERFVVQEWLFDWSLVR